MGKKGGSQKTTTEVKMHPEIERAALQNIQLANDVAAMGAMPYRGPTVAGFSPQQINGMAGFDQAAASFGMPNQGSAGLQGDNLYTALTGMPPPTQYAGGLSGYSGMGLADQQYAQLPPAQRAMLESFMIDPVTGAPPTAASLQGRAAYGQPLIQRRLAEEQPGIIDVDFTKDRIEDIFRPRYRANRAGSSTQRGRADRFGN